MARLIDLPEVGRDWERRKPMEPRPFNMPRDGSRRVGCIGTALGGVLAALAAAIMVLAPLALVVWLITIIHGMVA